MMTPSVEALKTAYGRFPSGVVALCAEVDGDPVGMVASSFSVGVSMEPPLVMFSVRDRSRTWPVLRGAVGLGVSILGSTHAAAARQLASRRGDRFADLELHRDADGAIFLEESPLWLRCRISAEVPAGDHRIVVLQVDALRVAAEHEPLVYHASRFHRLAAG